MMKKILSFFLAFTLLIGIQAQAQTSIKVSQLPIPTTGNTQLSTGDKVIGDRGGVTYGLTAGFGSSCGASQWVNTISAQGFGTCAQPNFSNLAGNIAVSQMNSGTGATSSTFWRGDGTWAAGGGGYIGSINRVTYLSGSGTYIPSAGTYAINIRMIGGGGGGAGSSSSGASNGGNGVTGGSTTFGSSLLTASGGGGGNRNGTPGAGGTATLNSPATGLAFAGSNGVSGTVANGGTYGTGGSGGASPFGGSGGGSPAQPTGGNTAGVANTGSGGGGAAGGAGAQSEGGAGGGSGGFIDANITSPAASYSYAVGVGGTGGTAGTGGNAGSNGGSGGIIITEYINTVTGGGASLALTATSLNGGQFSGNRNKIINGDMTIDQRNAGASVTPTSGQFTVDRWGAGLTQTAKFSVQQNAGAVTPPVGFSKYLGVTSLSSYSVASTDAFWVYQPIEGNNIVDLSYGNANAQTSTLSFWVRSSLTGTHSGSLCNGAGNRCYPYTYTINSANTWEYENITVSGDTTGTWTTDNTSGLVVAFNLGAGATASGTAGAWTGTAYRAATGAVSIVGTSGATFYVTGVQLERGSYATPFENVSYQQKLGNCQRYTFAIPAGSRFAKGNANATTSGVFFAALPVTMRAVPTFSGFGTWTFDEVAIIAANSTSAPTGTALGVNGISFTVPGFTGLTTPGSGDLSASGVTILSSEI